MGADLTAIQSARLAMLELCADLDLLCYDALADLQVASVENPLLYYVDDMHLNARGNRIFAELLHDWLSAPKSSATIESQARMTPQTGASQGSA